MTDPSNSLPNDGRERQEALDPRRSFIVQAPAGSGKTELLAQRILSLLAGTERPEEVLAITFTRKAAGEMRQRLLEALERARNQQPPEAEHARLTWQLAREVLRRDEEKGWRLLDNPARLQLQTIDSFCAMLTRRMPWLARFGEQARVTEDPERLYRSAAERLLGRLEQKGAAAEAVELLLRHLDNRLPLVRDLLVVMLGKRDQWLRHLLVHRETNARPLLESGLQRYVGDRLAHLNKLFDPDFNELADLAGYAWGNLAAAGQVEPAGLLDNLDDPGAAGALSFWLAVSELLLTLQGEVRKTVNVRLGFPAGKSGRSQEMKERMQGLLEKVSSDAPLLAALRELRRLPDIRYADEQWQVLRALIDLLPLAVVELEAVFRAEGAVDFIEVAGAARRALGETDRPEELLLQLDHRLRHILVDEFQDTSYGQYDLLLRLTAGWEEGDGRSLFLVGDPMQSIYLFREANVGLFLRTRRQGLGAIRLQGLTLRSNFRSQAALVDWFNQIFGLVFPREEEDLRGAVPFAAATACSPSRTGAAVTCTCYVERQDEAEARKVVDLIREARQEDPEGTVAVLGRSRAHLQALVRALQGAGLKFQAQELQPLAERQPIRDLMALTRALVHRGDRIAWLAVLRAPWCGLTLAELLEVCGEERDAPIWDLLNFVPSQGELFAEVLAGKSPALQRVLPVLRRALEAKGRVPLRRLVEATWLSLGGPACLAERDLEDVRQYFRLLDGLDAGGDLPALDELERQAMRLFAAPDPAAGPGIQLLTMHKAKGLEFDTVILPGLGRGVQGNERVLLRWLEHPDYELLLAPIPGAEGDGTEATYEAIGSLLKERETLETLRLFYVAATRARHRLHLLGHVSRRGNGQLQPAPGSLLASAWPALEEFCHRSLEDVPVNEALAATDSLPLRRLPDSWRLPVLETPWLDSEPLPARSASLTGHGGEERFHPSLRTEAGRIEGTLIHGLLEKIAHEGLHDWNPGRIRNERPLLERQLIGLGIPRHRLKDCIERITTCLDRVLGGKHAAWLLSSAADAGTEVGIHGLVAGELVHAVIDRTFVDTEGIRWVVDYKSSRPGKGEEEAAFVDRETSRYQEQVEIYCQLMQTLDPARPVRGALYFPWLDHLAMLSTRDEGRGRR